MPNSLPVPRRCGKRTYRADIHVSTADSSRASRWPPLKPPLKCLRRFLLALLSSCTSKAVMPCSFQWPPSSQRCHGPIRGATQVGVGASLSLSPSPSRHRLQLSSSARLVYIRCRAFSPYSVFIVEERPPPFSNATASADSSNALCVHLQRGLRGRGRPPFHHVRIDPSLRTYLDGQSRLLRLCCVRVG